MQHQRGAQAHAEQHRGAEREDVEERQHELKPKSFSYWVRRHRQAAGHVTLVPLAVQKPSATGELLLQHASGWQLALPTGVDAVWLAGLLRGMA